MKKRKPATTTLVIGWRIHPSNHAKLGRWLPFFSFLRFALGNLQRCWSTVFATGRVLRTSRKPHPSLTEAWRECGRMLRVRFVCGVDCSPCLLLGGHCGTCNVRERPSTWAAYQAFMALRRIIAEVQSEFAFRVRRRSERTKPE